MLCNVMCLNSGNFIPTQFTGYFPILVKIHIPAKVHFAFRDYIIGDFEKKAPIGLKKV